MRERLLALGAAFWALLGGAFISVAIAVYIDMVQGPDLPPGWGVVLSSTVCFGVCGIAWVALSMSLERLDASISAIPRKLGDPARVELTRDFTEGARAQLHRLLAVGMGSGVLGLLILPLRIAL